MTIASDLFALQEADTALDECDRELEKARAGFGESDEVAELGATLLESEARQRAARAQAHEIETRLQDLQAKIAPVEQKLYDGSVQSPKELQSIQEELEMLQRQRRAIEDQQLAAMEELETTTATVAAEQAQLAELERQWQASQDRLRAREQELKTERARLVETRQARSARIDAPRLAQYERLRQAKRGRAVAKVERGACLGCRITLPTTVYQRARSGLQVVQCTSCERILYVG